MYTRAKKGNMLVFTRVYVCVKAKLTFVCYFFLLFFLHLSLTSNCSILRLQPTPKGGVQCRTGTLGEDGNTLGGGAWGNTFWYTARKYQIISFYQTPGEEKDRDGQTGSIIKAVNEDWRLTKLKMCFSFHQTVKVVQFMAEFTLSTSPISWRLKASLN